LTRSHIILFLFRAISILILILWSKCIYDLSNAHTVWKDAWFPAWFNILFIVAWLAVFPLLFWCNKSLEIRQLNQHDAHLNFAWALIPISVFCVSPVCYKGFLLITGTTIGTIIRLSLILIPILCWIYKVRNPKSSIPLLIMLILALFALIPNDQCFNQFNYWYVRKIGMSPLTYLPIVINILLLSAAYMNKNRKALLMLMTLVSIGCLVISFGHRLKILW